MRVNAGNADSAGSAGNGNQLSVIGCWGCLVGKGNVPIAVRGLLFRNSHSAIRDCLPFLTEIFWLSAIGYWLSSALQD